jgi:hypothetical protein
MMHNCSLTSGPDRRVVARTDAAPPDEALLHGGRARTGQRRCRSASDKRLASARWSSRFNGDHGMVRFRTHA